jgi:hypothetical protein
MNRKQIICLILITMGVHNLLSQEVITGLTGNNMLTGRKLKAGAEFSKSTPDTLSLPFFEDFSYNGPFPDSTKWTDSFVFINNTFTTDQRTAGVATFDLLDETGKLYEEAESWVFSADRLTSSYIDLNYPESDSIWLSFLYQPGGLGDTPEPDDSLTLQFWSPETEEWYSIWKTTVSEVSPFRQVMIPVTGSQFLKKGFRFRFAAYGSLSPSAPDPAMKTSGDHWHIDYVKLDRNRHYRDTVLRDVAVTLPVRSLLNNHETIPLKHFRQIYLSEMGSSIPLTYSNNDTTIRNITRLFEITDLNTGTVVHSFSGGATNTQPLSVVNYNAPLFYTYSITGSDTVSYQVKSYLITDEFDPKSNDTIVYIQNFGNLFSFDDGTAEAGYGINGQGSRNAMVAYRFRAYAPDSLRAITICFNDSYQNSNQRAFDVAVWDNNDGIPGNLIYLGEEVMVEQGEGINGFQTYILDDPVFVDNVFFIGWKQRSETFLNAGLDLNTSHSGRQFFWLNGDWYQSQVNGSLMIRAITGPKLPSTGIKDISGRVNSVTVWPNPAIDILNIETDETIAASPFISHMVYDISGRLIMKINNVKNINLSTMKPGIYILISTHRGAVVSRNRFIKAG